MTEPQASSAAGLRSNGRISEVSARTAPTIALAPTLPVAIVGLVATGLGVGLPYAAVFNGAAASAPASPASAQALVGVGGLLSAIFGPPLVGTLLDATGDFAAGFLALATIIVAVLALTSLIRPFDLNAAALEA